MHAKLFTNKQSFYTTMKKILLVVLMGCTLMACHSDIDLKNIDTTSELELGLALPVGSVSAKLEDFIGKVNGLYIDTMENKPIIVWRDTFNITKKYHEFDKNKLVDSTTLALKVYNQIEATEMIGNNKKVIGDGTPRTLNFDFRLPIGINKQITQERFDSLLMDSVTFTSVIRAHNLPLRWEWIDKVTVQPGGRFRYPGNAPIQVYDKSKGGDYGQPLPGKLTDISLVLLKPCPEGSWRVYQYDDPANFYDADTLHVNFVFTIPSGKEVIIEEDAAFDYKLEARVNSFKAIWGYFHPGNEMYDAHVEDLTSVWKDLEFLTKAHLPVRDPEVHVYAYTEIAGALRVNGDSLFVEDADGQKRYAKFDEEGSTSTQITIQKGHYLDPITSPIGASTRDGKIMYIDFDKRTDHGQIDKLFVNMPQKIGYGFSVDFDKMATPQVRFTPNMTIEAEAACRLPISFNKGLFISYSDTIKDISITEFNLDSMIKANVSVIDTLKTADVTVILKAHNTIPVCVKAAMRCLDAAGEVIPDPENPSAPFILFPEDTIHLAPPYDANTGAPLEYGETVIQAQLSKKQLEVLPKLKQIEYTAIIDDESLAEAHKHNVNPVALRPQQGIKVKIGVTANANAQFNFNGDKNKQ